MSEDVQQSKASPWRWVLLVIAIVAAGYSVWYAGGTTDKVSAPASRVPVQTAQDETLCRLPDDIALEKRVDVRFQVVTDSTIRIARRLTGTVDDDGLHVPGLVADGVGTIRMGDNQYAQFEYTDGVCSAVHLVSEADAVDPDSEETP